MVKERLYKTEVVPRCLIFKRSAGTSRGVYTTRKLWEIQIRKEDEPPVIDIGEHTPLPDPSCDYGVDHEITLSKACLDLEQKGYVDTESLRHYPSILFGLKTAMRHYEQGGWRHYDTPFSQGQAGVPINGLVWMGDYKYMLEQVEEKMKEGFRCVKLKIGAIDFDRELSLLKHIRVHFSAREIELRVGANGAFTPSEAMDKLKRLAEIDLHSIEQPIHAGQLEEMARLAAESPLPIALDEGLIGCNAPDEKRWLLETIHPQYIILKSPLHGGITGCTEWIHLAETILGSTPERSKWWVTSALESQIGLSAVAQWCAMLDNPLLQGLGIGEIFKDDKHKLIQQKGDTIWFTNDLRLMPTQGDLQAFLAEWHDPSPFLEAQTSGSTGTPKRMRIREDRMLNSARLTCDYLGLKKGGKALLCMPLRYIAGKMMMVRSLYAGLDLEVCEPSGHPLADWGDTSLHFTAMIPLQIYNMLRMPEERKRLEQTDILIIGGGAVDAALEQEIWQIPNTVYSTYGMTETLSHVTLCRLNGPEASPYYHPFPSVTLSLSPDNTLTIDAPLVCDERLVMNDVTCLLPDGNFAIIGRKDNIINSGDVKIQIEEVEERLRPYLDLPYAITAAPGPRLGEAVILLIIPRSRETVSPSRVTPRMKVIMSDSAQLSYEVSTVALASLPKYLHPGHVIEASEIPQTGNGKIDRTACRELARNIITKTL